MMGAAIATTTAFASMACTLYIFAQRALRVPYRWDRVAVIAGVGGLCFAAWAVMPALQVWWIEAGLLAVYGGILAASGIISGRATFSPND